MHYCAYRTIKYLIFFFSPDTGGQTGTTNLKTGKSVSVMTTGHLNTRLDSTSETSFVSNILQTMDNIQHNIGILKQPLAQAFRQPC
jgi:hypothetical protein